jgi:hypothetical protein
MKHIEAVVKKALVGAVLVGLLGGSALAARIPLMIDDSFDYTDTGVDTTNLSLSYDAGELVFHLGADASSGLPVVEVGTYPRFDDGEVPADAFLAGELPGVELDLRGANLFAAGFAHEAGSLAEVVDAYVSELSDLGFTAELQSSDGNVVVYQFVSGSDSLRGVFTATATGGRAYLATNQ